MAERLAGVMIPSPPCLHPAVPAHAKGHGVGLTPGLLTALAKLNYPSTPPCCSNALDWYIHKGENKSGEHSPVCHLLRLEHSKPLWQQNQKCFVLKRGILLSTPKKQTQERTGKEEKG